jgi:hypothetical protein
MANQNLLGYTLPEVMPAAIATGLFVSLCTIQQPDGVLIDAGQPSGNYINVAGLVNIPCMAPPMSEARLQATEIRAMDDIEAFAPLHVLLNAWYPQIKEGVSQGWIAVVDGVVLTLLGAESDSQMQMTRLAVRFGAV